MIVAFDARRRPPQPAWTQLAAATWLWGPVALALLIAGMAFLITLAVGKTDLRDHTTAEAEQLSMAMDAAYQQQASYADDLATRRAEALGH